MTLDSLQALLPDLSSLTLVGLPATVALAAVALIGYVFGARTRDRRNSALNDLRQQELDRAARIAWQLEGIADALRQDLVVHHAQVAAFKRRLSQAKKRGTDTAWEQLCAEAEAMLGPTMQLAHQLSHAYDRIRQQSDALETFTSGRTDPLTGVGNARALEQHLRVLLASASRGICDFTIALISLDRQPAKSGGPAPAPVQTVLPKLAAVIRTCMRESDFVARYGDDEFVLVMPHTAVAGAVNFVERLQRRVVHELAASVCCGLTQAQTGDDSRSLFARADSALYSARAAGGNRLFIHAGGHIREQHVDTTAVFEGGARDARTPAESKANDAELAAV